MSADTGVGVGISIGLHQSSVAVFKDGVVTVLPNDRGNKFTPSVISFDGTTFSCGEAARRRLGSHPYVTIFDLRRLLGCLEEDPEVDFHVHYWPFVVTPHNGRYHYLLNGGIHFDQERLWPETAIAILINYMRRLAEDFLKEPVKEAVLTIPACLGINERLGLRHAGQIAGLTRAVHLVNETTAVALAYVFDRKLFDTSMEERQDVLFCNMGAGSTDATVFTLKGYRVKARSSMGCPYLGGVDYTNCLVGYMSEEVKIKHKADVYEYRLDIIRMRRVAEKVKKQLTTRARSEVRMNRLACDVDYRSYVTRRRFEQILETETTLSDVIQDCILEARTGVEEVFLTGGTSRIPYFWKLIREVTGMAPDLSMHAEESPAIGAAIRCANFTTLPTKPVGALNVTERLANSIRMTSIGVDNHVVVKRNHRLPCSAELLFKLPRGSYKNPPLVIWVYEGESSVPEENTSLGEIYVHLSERQRHPNWPIRVRMEVDHSGVLSIISVRDDKLALEFEFQRRSLPEAELEVLAEWIAGLKVRT